MKKVLALLLLSLTSTLVIAEEEKKEGFLPKVDKPISDTYEPLDGADWNHRMSDELKALREYQDQQKPGTPSAQDAQRRRELEAKIQAPDPGAASTSPEPAIEEENSSLRISDPE